MGKSSSNSIAVGHGELLLKGGDGDIRVFSLLLNIPAESHHYEEVRVYRPLLLGISWNSILTCRDSDRSQANLLVAVRRYRRQLFSLGLQRY